MRPAAATRTRFAASSRSTGAASMPTATACSARCTTPRTRSRRRSCARGAACRASRDGARCARGSTRSRPTPASTRSRAGRSACSRSTTGPPTEPGVDVGEPLVESVWIEPYPDERLGLDGRLRGARGPLRAARGRGAGLRRGAPASAGDPAGGPDHARGARLLGPRGVGVAGDDGRLGEQRAATRAQGGRRAAPRAEPAGDAALARRRAGPRARRRLHRRLGERRRRRRCASCWPTTPTFSMPPWSQLVARRRRRSPASRRDAMEFCAEARAVPTRANGQLAIAYYSRDAETGRYKATAIDVAHARGLADQGHHGLHPAGALRALRPAAGARRAIDDLPAGMTAGRWTFWTRVMRRTLGLLAVATAIGAVGLAAGGSAGALLAEDMTGSTAWAGVPLGVLVVGSAASALLISRRTSRAGDARPGSCSATPSEWRERCWWSRLPAASDSFAPAAPG